MDTRGIKMNKASTFIFNLKEWFGKNAEEMGFISQNQHEEEVRSLEDKISNLLEDELSYVNSKDEKIERLEASEETLGLKCAELKEKIEELMENTG